MPLAGGGERRGLRSSLVSQDVRVAAIAGIAVALVWQLLAIATSLGYDSGLTSQTFIQEGGEGASLPPQVAEFSLLLRRGGIGLTGCSLSGKLKSDSLLMQRAYESIYPVRIEDASRSCVLRIDDDGAPSTCHISMEGQHAQVLSCP